MFSVDINDDAIVEASETFQVSLTNVIASSVPADSINVSATATGTITDNDTASITIEDTTVTESGVLTFTATLDSTVDGGFTVDTIFNDLTAIGSGIDYDSNTQTLSFIGTAGETQVFTVAVNNDLLIEGSETFEVGLTGVVTGTAPASALSISCLLYTSPSPRDRTRSRMPSSA